MIWGEESRGRVDYLIGVLLGEKSRGQIVVLITLSCKGFRGGLFSRLCMSHPLYPMTKLARMLGGKYGVEWVKYRRNTACLFPAS